MFENLGDEDLWRRADTRLLSVGEIACHMAYWLIKYAWGMIPATVRIGKTEWKTALWPKDGLNVVPLKDSVRKAEGLQEGEVVTVLLGVG